MSEREAKLLAGSASRLWDNGGSVATTVPKPVREVLGLVAGERVSWIPVGLCTVFMRRIGAVRPNETDAYRKGIESDEWAVRIASIASLTFPKGGEKQELCAVCGDGRDIAVTVGLSICGGCDQAIAAAVAQTRVVYQEGLGLADSSGGRDSNAGAGGGDDHPTDDGKRVEPSNETPPVADVAGVGGEASE